MTDFAEQGACSKGMPSGGSHEHSWKAEIEMDEEEDDIEKASVLSDHSSGHCSHGSSAYSCSTSGSSRTCSSSASSRSSASTCSCSVSEGSELDPRANLPYPSYVPVSWYYLEQTTRPRNWCLWLISNPYPFYYHILVHICLMRDHYLIYSGLVLVKLTNKQFVAAFTSKQQLQQGKWSSFYNLRYYILVLYI